ncbi:uncharacterized protein LOC113553133 isoform X2 [Rhopalosiphum maidis]|uniref:uncharacterized protein LOC113553133 isoform X2 n=1 Tax=Rhopalosiphum maidis TaxID=43146 RepID=UPI000EFFEB61|nr:uncharacterized protein LOC113553133 isoform X2 [Rhopalosiphum maidis]
MFKTAYCFLFLLVSCLIYEAYGNHHRVKSIRTPSRVISNNIGPYDSSSSLTAAEADGAAEDTTTSESAAALPSPRPLRKSFSSNDSLGYDGNRGLGLDNKSRRGTQSIRQKPYNMDLGDLHNGQRQNSMISEENQNTRKRQNTVTSDFQNFPNLTQIKMNPSAKHTERLRQKPLPPSLNEDNSQQTNDNVENSGMVNFNKNPFNDRDIIGQRFSMSIRKCCINGNCRILKDGEDCGIEDYFRNIKNTQQLKNPMFATSSNGDDGFQDVMSKLMDERFKSFRLNSFNRFGNSFDEHSNIQKIGKPTNMRLGSMRYPTSIPSFDSNNDISNGMGSFVNMPQRTKPINYPYSEPMGLSEDEVDEIRNKVLQQSNLYRKKYNLVPFTLDDQLTNCAQDWANKIAKQGIFQHRDNNVYGENLYADSDLNNLGKKAVDAWYNEITKFNIDDKESELGSNSATHHMTQLLWKSSTKLGVGISKTPNGMYNVVANYDPRGNMIGSFQDNLPQIKQEDIEEANESERAIQSAPKSGWWSSDSSFPLQSGWNNNKSIL